MPFFSGFNPFNPFHVLEAMRNPPAIYPVQPRREGKPIQIEPHNSDPGMQVTSGKDTVTIRGDRTEGAKVVRGDSGYVRYEVARGMSFTLDVDSAPTVDVFGRTNFTEKNSRIYTLDTRPGLSAADCARALADKVNARDDFRAQVRVGDDGSATIHLSRR